MVPYVRASITSLATDLTTDDLDRLAKIAPPGAAAGGRYPFAHSYGDSPEKA